MRKTELEGRYSRVFSVLFGTLIPAVNLVECTFNLGKMRITKDKNEVNLRRDLT